MNCKELESEIAKTQKQMKKAAAELDFEKAAELRDRMIMLKSICRRQKSRRILWKNQKRNSQ